MVGFLSPANGLPEDLLSSLSLLLLLLLGLLDLPLLLFLESDRLLLRLFLLLLLLLLPLRLRLLPLLPSVLSPSSPSRLSVSHRFLAGSLRSAAGRIFATGELTPDFGTNRDP